MTTQRDYYEILGLHRDAAEADIKTAYRRLAMKHHPDRNPGNQEAEQHFKEAKEAYEVLSNPQKRQAYDRFGHAGVQGSMGGGGHGGGFNDIFESIFGDFGDIFGGGRRDSMHRGADLRYDLSVTLEQAVFGTAVEIDFPAQAECEECKGSGAKPGTKRETCPDCEGHGQIRMQRGFFTVQQTCPTCQGQGEIIKSPCPSCRGQGRIRKTKYHRVTIPAGVDEGDRIRLNGEGESGVHSGPAGDLYVFISVKPHEIFKREQAHLFCEVPISFVTAVLGGEIEVPTLTGKMKLKIPPETQSGKVFRLRGKGVKPAREHSAGDLLCRIVVETPVNLTAEQKGWLRQFEASTQSNAKAHTPKAHSWFEGVKCFFEGGKNS